MNNVMSKKKFEETLEQMRKAQEEFEKKLKEQSEKDEFQKAFEKMSEEHKKLWKMLEESSFGASDMNELPPEEQDDVEEPEETVDEAFEENPFSSAPATKPVRLWNPYRGLMRNKETGKSEWVYGDLLTNLSEHLKIVEKFDDGAVGIYDVDDETVGASTGLQDAEGREIFEGDLVVRKDGERFFVRYAQKFAAFVLTAPDAPTIIEAGLGDTSNLIVIGNEFEGIDVDNSLNISEEEIRS